MPIGAPCQRPEPKSACSPMPAPMLAINASEFGSTGRPEISPFHGLSAGNGSAPFSGAFAPSDAAERLPYVAPLAAPPCDGDADDVAAPSLPPPPPQPASQTEARVVMKILGMVVSFHQTFQGYYTGIVLQAEWRSIIGMRTCFFQAMIHMRR